MYEVYSIEDTILDKLIKSYQTQQETIENHDLKEELKQVDEAEANIARRILCAREIEFLDLNDDFLMMMDKKDQKDIELKESIASIEAYVNENLILQKENDELKAEINMVMEEKEKLTEDLKKENNENHGLKANSKELQE